MGRGVSSRVAALVKSGPEVDTEIAPPFRVLQSMAGARKALGEFLGQCPGDAVAVGA